MICGFCADKNVSDCLEVILEHTPVDKLRVINSSHPRAMKCECLRDALKACNEKLGKAWNEGMEMRERLELCCRNVRNCRHNSR